MIALCAGWTWIAGPGLVWTSFRDWPASTAVPRLQGLRAGHVATWVLALLATAHLAAYSV